MASTRSSTPSNHEATAMLLSSRGYQFVPSARIKGNDKLSFGDEWDAFVAACGCSGDASSAAEKLCPVLEQYYLNETDFDRAVFDAMKDLIEDSEYVDVKRNIFSFPGKKVGLSRQVQRDKLGFPEDYGLSKKSITDHSIVILNRSDGFLDQTGLVQLKMDDSNCAPFDLNERYIFQPELADRHGALAQTLASVAGDVFNCLVRNGLTPATIPVTTLSGRRESRKGTPRLLCVRAELRIPEEPASFKYSILDFEEYGNDDCYKRSLAIYLHTLRVGIEHANTILSNARSPSILCAQKFPRSVFGGGGQDIFMPELPLILSPIPKPRTPIDDPVSSHPLISISQGELFYAEVNLKALQEKLDQDTAWTWFPAVDQGPSSPAFTPVLIKITSMAVHNYLIPPYDAYIAMGVLARNEGAKASLAHVLIASGQNGQNNFITVMKDLRDRYHDLRPSKVVEEVPDATKGHLWRIFEKLVTSTLIPMARCGVVHADIRPGWDKTSNILFQMEDAHSERMVLIDFESLCRGDASIESVDKRLFKSGSDAYFPQSRQTGAMKTVWWQCLLMACSWLEETEQLMLDSGSFVRQVNHDDLTPYANLRERLSVSDLDSIYQDSKRFRSIGDVQTCERLLTRLLAILDKAFGINTEGL